jgi:hypothetical protein
LLFVFAGPDGVFFAGDFAAVFFAAGFAGFFVSSMLKLSAGCSVFFGGSGASRSTIAVGA